MADRLRFVRRLIAVAAGIVLVAQAMRRIGLPLSRYIVDGASMEPAYRAGDRVLVNRLAYRRRPPKPGDVVVLRDPERVGRYLLKRIALAPVDPTPRVEPHAGAPSGVWVLGDNAAESRDSRRFGAVPPAAIIGQAWRVY